MGVSITQVLGIILVGMGAALVVGFKWIGTWIVGIGIVFILFGLYLARHIFDKQFRDESKFTPGDSQSDE